MTVLVLDNYDSFTGNLVQGLEEAGAACIVHRSDRISLRQVEALAPDRIVISPGPLGPGETGCCSEVVTSFLHRVPIMGVCLGMQVIAQTSGATVVASGKPVHGRASTVAHDGRGLFEGVPNPFQAARYHSLVVEPGSLPPFLKATAWTEDGILMGCRVEGSRVEGLMFHPESFLTGHRAAIFANFLRA